MSDRNSIDNLPKEIQIAIKELEEFEKTCVNPNMRMEALNREMWIRDQIVLINMEKNAKIDGYAEGVKATAKNMKALGSTPDFIAQATGLDLETIENL